MPAGELYTIIINDEDDHKTAGNVEIHLENYPNDINAYNNQMGDSCIWL